MVASGGDGCVWVDAREGDRGGDELEEEVEASRGCRGAILVHRGGARRAGGGMRRPCARRARAMRPTGGRKKTTLPVVGWAGQMGCQVRPRYFSPSLLFLFSNF